MLALRPKRAASGRRARRAAWSAVLVAAAGVHAGDWAVSPLDPGSDLPPVGRSLFDTLYAARGAAPPFPFGALAADLASRLGCGAGAGGCIKTVRIPLGRSLQRDAAAPDYFAHPRVVLAVSGESGRSPHAARDRLYIGYQERAAVLEVLSYNAAAGRFEFQIVSDYRAGTAPRIRYARRTLCIACHQNQAPIFSRAQWDETDANPRIAARLAASGASAYGLPEATGVDIPNAILDAANRANLYGAAQKLWREACRTPRCRAGLLEAALLHRLAGARGEPGRTAWREAVLPEFEAYARASGALSLPDADLPNRDPLAQTYRSTPPGDPVLAGVPAALDPLLPRAPRAIWPATGAVLAARVLPVLSDMLAAYDIAALERRLADLPKLPLQRQALACRAMPAGKSLDLSCQGAGDSGFTARLDLSAGTATLRDLRMQGHALGDLDLPALRPARRGGAATLQAVPLRAGQALRLPDGSRVVALDINWIPERPAEGGAEIVVRREFEPLARALAELAESNATALAAGIYDGSALADALLARLGAPAARKSAPDLPPPQATADAPVHGAPLGQLGLFYRHCGSCHQEDDAAPPNFLYGGAARVAAMLRQCAPRMSYRLAMAKVAPRERAKTPMPPELALQAAGIAPHDWASGAELSAMLAQVATWGAAAQPADWRNTQYETLPPCVPQAKQGERP
ncbi:MAG: hypothetical protein JNJ60_23820 [Rhodocyclaceae bacterium]|nr:hypothetical protein [Rhodocyclaceae bacterium]